MGKLRSMKCGRVLPIRHDDNIISSSYYKYKPVSWKYMEGEPEMCLLISNEYQRMWMEEEREWQQLMHPPTPVNRVKQYVETFKANYLATKLQAKKLPFKMKK